MVPIPATLKGRSLLRIADFTPSELSLVLEHAERLKARQRERIEHRLLVDRAIALLFEKPSTRTRVSFTAGMAHLGGTALGFPTSDLHLGDGEPLRDTSLVISRYVDGIVFRAYAHSSLEELALYAEVPVINGLTDTHHPCQALADALTIKERFGSIAGTRVAFIGDGNNNVCHSLIEICAALGGSLVVASPPGYGPAEEITAAAAETAAVTGATIEYGTEARTAASGADVVYTDVWTSMGREAEIEERRVAFALFGVDESIFALASDRAVLMHCLPARVGEEVTEPLLYGERSAVWDQAENRMHAQKALLSLIIR
jgi:ornithine carbamoyltransferase